MEHGTEPWAAHFGGSMLLWRLWLQFILLSWLSLILLCGDWDCQKGLIWKHKSGILMEIGMLTLIDPFENTSHNCLKHPFSRSDIQCHFLPCSQLSRGCGQVHRFIGLLYVKHEEISLTCSVLVKLIKLHPVWGATLHEKKNKFWRSKGEQQK